VIQFQVDAEKQVMATCPDCGRYLADDHRCSGKRWRSVRMAIIAVGGALFTMLSVLIAVGDASVWIVVAAAVVGAIVSAGVWRAVGF
jgi:hypothetical protein